MKIHTDLAQGSVEWLLIRAGKVTASEMDALITPLGKIRTGDGVTTYLNQKLCERWTGGPLLQLQGIFDVEQGQILEERAKPAFTLQTGIELQNVAFVETDNAKVGCSPDGLIGEISGVEIKCPRIDTQIGRLLAGVLPKEYVAQVQGSMFVTGRATWHFFSYHTRLPAFHLIVERDKNFHTALHDAIDDFLNRMDVGWDRLCELNGGPPIIRSFQPTQPQPKFESETPT